MMLRSVRTAAVAALWLVPLLIFVSAFSSEWVGTWRTFGVPSMTPRFVDLDSIPTAIETLHQGGDPLVKNWADPYHRPLNYPRVWMYLFSAAGITTENLSTAAIALCALFLGCISFLILDAKHPADAAILLLAGLSVSPLFAMERGNNDMFIFVLVFVACFVTNGYLKSGLFGAAALLKLYPVIAMMIDATRRSIKERAAAVLAILFVAALILLQWRDVALIRHSTPVSSSMSYGAFSLEGELLHRTMRWGFLASLGWAVVAECWLFGALAIRKAWGRPFEEDATIAKSKSAELFSVFGGIYVFTYAVGSNWDYRLIFLLPTIPLALEMARSVRHRWWGVAYLVLVGVAENSVALESTVGTLAGHVATFILFILLLIMLTNQARNLYGGRTDPVLAEA